MTNTSMANLLFSKQERNIAEFINSGSSNKIYDNKTLKNKEKTECNGNREAEREKLASFKTVYENEVKKQNGDKKKKDGSSIEDLKKRKDIKPFYVIPKDKKKSESLLIKADKKIAEKHIKELDEQKTIKQKLVDLIADQGVFTVLKNDSPGKKSADILNKQLLKTLAAQNKKEHKLSTKPKLVVIDLREKVPVDKKTYNTKTDKLKKVKIDPKVESKLEIKPHETGLNKDEIKLFTKNNSNQAYDAELKTDFHNRHIPVKQMNTQFSQLQKNLNTELVKHTRLIIKDGGNGEIRLVLKPKTLGSVRVKLNIQDNNIVGKIFVDNNIVKELVQNSLNNLYNAFKQDGFNQALINVFVGSEKNQAHAEMENFETVSAQKKTDDVWNQHEIGVEEYSYADSLVNILL
jgi:flagellar protein FlbC